MKGQKKIKQITLKKEERNGTKKNYTIHTLYYTRKHKDKLRMPYRDKQSLPLVRQQRWWCVQVVGSTVLRPPGQVWVCSQSAWCSSLEQYESLTAYHSAPGPAHTHTLIRGTKWPMSWVGCVCYDWSHHVDDPGDPDHLQQAVIDTGFPIATIDLWPPEISTRTPTTHKHTHTHTGGSVSGRFSLCDTWVWCVRYLDMLRKISPSMLGNGTFCASTWRCSSLWRLLV